MHLDRERRRLFMPLLVLVLLLGFPSLCASQWLPSPGEGSVAVNYQYTRVTDHLFSHSVEGLYDPASGYTGGPGERWYMGDIYGQTANVTASVGIWRRLALSGGVAYLVSKYKGKSPEASIDDGKYHGGLQDASFALEYMIPWQSFAITPLVGISFPTRDYPTIGHVSVGSGLHVIPVGVSVGRSLAPLLPRAFLSTSFTYSIVENYHGYSLDQRSLNFAGGYSVSRKVAVGGMMQFEDTIDGIDWYSDTFTEEVFHDHDLAAQSRALRGGGYVSFSIGRSFGVRVSYVSTLSGENTHAANSITITPTWNFRTPFGG